LSEPDPLIARTLAREPAAVARAISVVEDRRAAAQPRIVALLRELGAAGLGERCHRIGITGPPGVGKSSLVSALGRALRSGGRTVAVLAVDPSSPRSGGALLGDRARIETDPADHGMFVRSMASGGDLGGLARAAGAAIDVLGAAFDVVLVETTGVGQSETDVEHVTDSVVLVIQPASGDVLQFLKAGILEIPDLLVVNKMDLGDPALRAASELGSALAIDHAASGATPPPILRTSATSGQGIPELVAALAEHRAGIGDLGERRRAAAARWAERLYRQRFGDDGVERAGGREALRARLRELVRGGASAVEAVEAVRRH
jgi:LAO/AO transport system kinase